MPRIISKQMRTHTTGETLTATVNPNAEYKSCKKFHHRRVSLSSLAFDSLDKTGSKQIPR